jgi:hypothetical protein
MNPSDLPWWAWMLAALVIAFLSWMAFVYGETKDHRFRAVGYSIGFIASLVGIIALVRFIKWIWEG